MTTIKETLMKMSEEEQSTGDGSLIRRINCPVPVIPRPYARGDALGLTPFPRLAMFQSTPLREGRPTTPSKVKEDTKFQSTPLREGRLYRLYYTHIQSFLFCISRIKSLLLIKSRTKKYNRYNRLIINHSEPYEIRAMH